MHPRRIVLLDQVAIARRRPVGGAAGRLRGLGEVALGAIGGEAVGRHTQRLVPAAGSTTLPHVTPAKAGVQNGESEDAETPNGFRPSPEWRVEFGPFRAAARV